MRKIDREGGREEEGGEMSKREKRTMSAREGREGGRWVEIRGEETKVIRFNLIRFNYFNQFTKMRKAKITKMKTVKPFLIR